jgi:hypothetical protein
MNLAKESGSKLWSIGGEAATMARSWLCPMTLTIVLSVSGKSDEPMRAVASTGLSALNVSVQATSFGRRAPAACCASRGCWKPAESGNGTPLTTIPVPPQMTVLIECVSTAISPSLSTTTMAFECLGSLDGGGGESSSNIEAKA